MLKGLSQECALFGKGGQKGVQRGGTEALTLTTWKDSRIRLGGTIWQKKIASEGEDYRQESVMLI